jgi:hypothetical protein
MTQASEVDFVNVGLTQHLFHENLISRQEGQTKRKVVLFNIFQ